MARVAGWVREASRVAVLTGAGISTDSGVPDFRGPNGVWTSDPSKARLVELGPWVAEPELRVEGWEWLRSWRLGELEPNTGHAAIASLHQQEKLLLCVTQNTDGLHEAAGLPPERLVQIHGSRRHINCLNRHSESWLDFTGPAGSLLDQPSKQARAMAEVPSLSPGSLLRGSCDFWCSSEHLLERVAAGEADPRCPSCGCILKTANISFGQGLVQRDISAAMAAAEGCDLLLALGSQLSVGPINMMVPAAKRAGARVVIVNAEAVSQPPVPAERIRLKAKRLLGHRRQWTTWLTWSCVGSLATSCRGWSAPPRQPGSEPAELCACSPELADAAHSYVLCLPIQPPMFRYQSFGAPATAFAAVCESAHTSASCVVSITSSNPSAAKKRSVLL